MTKEERNERRSKLPIPERGVIDLFERARVVLDELIAGGWGLPPGSDLSTFLVGVAEALERADLREAEADQRAYETAEAAKTPRRASARG